MTKANRELVLYRLQKARETLKDACILAGAGRWNPCVNRLYYACFYAVSALLVRQGLSSSKHAGVRGLFNQYFVKTGKVAKEELQVRPWLSDAEAFVESIAVLIEKGEE